MNRRLFFKNMLGVGLVTLLPMPVFNEIVRNSKQHDSYKDIANGFWLFYHHTLIAYSYHPSNLSFKNDYTYWFDNDDVRQWRLLRKSISLRALHLQVVRPDLFKYSLSSSPVYCVLKMRQHTCQGEFYMTSIDYNEHDNRYIDMKSSGAIDIIDNKTHGIIKYN